MWDLVPWPGTEPGPPHWEHTVLATGPPGKSPRHLILLLQKKPRLREAQRQDSELALAGSKDPGFSSDIFYFIFFSKMSVHFPILSLVNNQLLRKMVTITLYARQQKRHRCIEQSFGLCGRGRGWDDLGEWHWNMYNIISETNHQSRFDAWYWMLGAGALRRPREMVRGGRREEGLGWGTRVHLWRIHVDVWQNQYNIVK